MIAFVITNYSNAWLKMENNVIKVWKVYFLNTVFSPWRILNNMSLDQAWLFMGFVDIINNFKDPKLGSGRTT